MSAARVQSSWQPPNAVTLLASLDENRPATKVFDVDESGIWHKREVRMPYLNKTGVVQVDDVSQLEEVLNGLSGHPNAYVIRGGLLETASSESARRLVKLQEDGTLPTFADVARSWIMIDIITSMGCAMPMKASG